MACTGELPGVTVRAVAAGTNEAERQRWNNPQWAELWPRRERLTSLIAPALLDALALTLGGECLTSAAEREPQRSKRQRSSVRPAAWSASISPIR